MLRSKRPLHNLFFFVATRPQICCSHRFSASILVDWESWLWSRPAGCRRSGSLSFFNLLLSSRIAASGESRAKESNESPVKMASDSLSNHFPLNYFRAVLSCGSHESATMKKTAVKLLKLQTILDAEANKGSYFPAEMSLLPLFADFLL